ncbi:protein FRIGIDA [Salix suchowensis]|nr:protein FRIGIDA [Salix suchowensis]
MMCGRGLRKYIVSNLANVEKLREEVPAALKCAPKPAKLVLDCIGRFYLQGSKAYEKESPMITGREASILVLEFFLLISDHENAMEDAVKKEAEQVAIAWRKRLISEGGVRKSGEIDAKGLLLLIGGFGIPRLFSDEDVFDLVNLSKSRQFAGLVRRSRLLVTRVTDIIEGMMKKGMKVEAVDVACIFGIEDKFPVQKLLTLVLQESREPSEGRKRKANNSPSIHLQKEAKEKQLIALKSVVKFLEEHQLDPTKLLPGWQLQEKTIELEKDIVDLNKKIGKLPLSKRPENVNEVTNYWKSQEIKRRRFAEKGSPLISPGVGLADQIAASYMDGQSSYNSVMRLNGGFPGHVNNYSAGTSAMYGSSLGPFPKNVPGTSASGIGLSAAYGGSAGVHRDMLVDGTGQIKGGNVPHYAWHRAGDTALNDGSVGHWHHASGLFGKSQSIEGFAGLLNSPPAAANGSSAPDLYGFADAPSLTARQSAASDLYGFADAPTVTANHIAASGLYRFPDAVAYGSTRRTGPFPPGLGSLHSSYKR